MRTLKLKISSTRQRCLELIFNLKCLWQWRPKWFLQGASTWFLGGFGGLGRFLGGHGSVWELPGASQAGFGASELHLGCVLGVSWRVLEAS